MKNLTNYTLEFSQKELNAIIGNYANNMYLKIENYLECHFKGEVINQSAIEKRYPDDLMLIKSLCSVSDSYISYEKFMERIDKIIEEEQIARKDRGIKNVFVESDVILATERDKQVFFDAIENPREPNDALKEAFKKSKDFFEEDPSLDSIAGVIKDDNLADYKTLRDEAINENHKRKNK